MLQKRKLFLSLMSIVGTNKYNEEEDRNNDNFDKIIIIKLKLKSYSTCYV